MLVQIDSSDVELIPMKVFPDVGSTLEKLVSEG